MKRRKKLIDKFYNDIGDYPATLPSGTFNPAKENMHYLYHYWTGGALAYSAGSDTSQFGFFLIEGFSIDDNTCGADHKIETNVWYTVTILPSETWNDLNGVRLSFTNYCGNVEVAEVQTVKA